MSDSKVWIEKFKLWLNIVKKACPAGAGPGGLYCMWIGRNCSYNDCPRRSHEEIYVKSDEDLTVEQLRNELNDKNAQITTLTEKLRTIPEAEQIEI